jgi:hypothetical protein
MVNRTRISRKHVRQASLCCHQGDAHREQVQKKCPMSPANLSYVRQGEDVGNRVWVVPHLAKIMEIANHVGILVAAVVRARSV